MCVFVLSGEDRVRFILSFCFGVDVNSYVRMYVCKCVCIVTCPFMLGPVGLKAKKKKKKVSAH